MSTDLAGPWVAELLRAYGAAAEVDGRGVWVDVRAGMSPAQVELVRELLRHGGTGTVGRSRRWTAAVFEEAVRRGGDRAAELLGDDALIDAVPPGEVLGWGVVANVVRQRLHGQELDPRPGLRHFSAGTRVWVSGVWNGDGGERLWVVGPHRGSRRPVRMVVQRRHLERARARAVYSPVVLRRLETVSRMVYETAGAAGRWAAQLTGR